MRVFLIVYFGISFVVHVVSLIRLCIGHEGKEALKRRPLELALSLVWTIPFWPVVIGIVIGQHTSYKPITKAGED